MAFSTSSFSQAPFASQGTVSPTVVLTGISCRSIARVSAITVVSGSLIIVPSADTGTHSRLGTVTPKNDSSLTTASTSSRARISTNTVAINDSLIIAQATSTRSRLGIVEAQVTEVILNGVGTRSATGTVTAINDSLIVASSTSTKGVLSTNTTVTNDSLIVPTSVNSKVAIGTVEPQVIEIVSIADTVSAKGSLGTASAKNDSFIVLTAISTKSNISTNTTAVGVIFDFNAVRDTFSQARTVYVERRTTEFDRTVNVSVVPRVAFAPRQTTTGDRTIFVPFEDRKVYVERQTTSAERTVRVAA